MRPWIVRYPAWLGGGLNSFSGTVGETTLSVDQIASHSHQAKYGNAGGFQGFTIQDDDQNWWRDNLISSSGGSQSHTHGMTGSSTTGNNIPPYYSMSLIMRIS